MMKRIAVLAVSAWFVAACGSQAEQSAPASKDEVQEVVRQYILENPEIIRDALIELQRRENAKAMEDVRKAAVANKDRLLDDRAPTLGAETPEVTIVEFFDYNCSYCRLSAGWVQETLEAHDDRVKVVFRDFPVRESSTGTSVEAMKASHAAREQDKYAAFHFALMGATDRLTSERIDEIAESVGVNVEQMRADMESMDVDDLINDTMVLAAEIGVEGTPFYVIGDQVVPGANIEMLEDALESQLSGS
ncbi:DsbA family protein [Euryhalocaulis caribicus]|uniref:DsbA family protein n=1 Tax=Euryhalocaulis caribicus TaxID=1161401 RepID=UPI0003AB3ED4|nr:DsbA family protein [Euryhalocaulis caribicus]